MGVWQESSTTVVHFPRRSRCWEETLCHCVGWGYPTTWMQFIPRRGSVIRSRSPRWVILLGSSATSITEASHKDEDACMLHDFINAIVKYSLFLKATARDDGREVHRRASARRAELIKLDDHGWDFGSRHVDLFDILGVILMEL